MAVTLKETERMECFNIKICKTVKTVIKLI